MRELDDLETRTAKGTSQIDFTATDRRTKRLLSVENISKDLGGRTLFRDVSFTLTPGTRLGLLGLNGTGKTTLLRILSGEIGVDTGTVERAQALRIVYFDQAREQLDREQTLRQGLGAHGDTVIFQDKPIHVAGWAKRFLFDSGQLDRPMSSLSGGEQARVLIARLMLQPADLLLLDEPTNDLDIPTLEVLEDSLTDFPGALVLVTHDRYLLDRVSTVVLGLVGRGGAQLFADYWQWEQAKMDQPEILEAGEAKSRRTQAPCQEEALFDLEAQREFEQMETRMLEAEQQVEARSAPKMHSPRSGLRRPPTASLLRKTTTRREPGVHDLYRPLGRVGKPNRPSYPHEPPPTRAARGSSEALTTAPRPTTAAPAPATFIPRIQRRQKRRQQLQMLRGGKRKRRTTNSIPLGVRQLAQQRRPQTAHAERQSEERPDPPFRLFRSSNSCA